MCLTEKSPGNGNVLQLLLLHITTHGAELILLCIYLWLHVRIGIVSVHFEEQICSDTVIMATSQCTIRPFKIDIPQSEVDRLQRKLRDTRIPQKPIIPDAGEDYGKWTIHIYMLSK